jgi:hypothetical protein
LLLDPPEQVTLVWCELGLAIAAELFRTNLCCLTITPPIALNCSNCNLVSPGYQCATLAFLTGLDYPFSKFFTVCFYSLLLVEERIYH